MTNGKSFTFFHFFHFLSFVSPAVKSFHLVLRAPIVANMIRYFLLLGVLAGAALAAETNSVSLAKELESFRPFLKTWKGTFIGGKNPNPASDVCRFERALNGQAIRVLHSVNEGVYGGETMIVFNGDSKKIETYYFTTSADVSQGTMEIDKGGAITSVETFKGESSDPNSVTKARATSKLLPDGRLHVKSEYLKKSGDWVPGHEIIYSEAPKAEVVFK